VIIFVKKKEDILIEKMVWVLNKKKKFPEIESVIVEKLNKTSNSDSPKKKKKNKNKKKRKKIVMHVKIVN